MSDRNYSYFGYGTADLAGSIDDGPPYRVSGVALADFDKTRTRSGTKVWTPAALDAAGHTLAENDLGHDFPGDGLAVVDHSESARDVVGEVTDSAYVDGVGVVYEADIDDEDLAQSIDAGRLDVSVRAMHTPNDELEVDDDGNQVIHQEDLKRLVHLSLEQSGASPSNFVESGPSEELANLSATELSAALHGGGSDGSDRPEIAGPPLSGHRKRSRKRSKAKTKAKTKAKSKSKQRTDASAKKERLARQRRAKRRRRERQKAGAGQTDLAESSVHKPDFSGTTTSDWSRPSQDDFSTDDLGEIGDHFVFSTSGFPPDNFGDLALPVVEPDGTLNKSALSSALGYLDDTEGLTGDDKERARSILNSLQGEFEDSDSDSEESDDGSDDSEESDSSALPPGVSSASNLGGSVGRYYDRETESADSASVEIQTASLAADGGRRIDYGTTTAEAETIAMSKDYDITELSQDIEGHDDPVIVERADLEALADDAERVSDLEAANESLENDLDTMRGPAAAALEGPLGLDADVIVDRFETDELQNLAQRHVDTVEDDDDKAALQAFTPSPKSGDPEADEDGDGNGESGGGSGGSDEDDEETNARARSIMDGSDVRQMIQQDLSAAEFVRKHKDMEPSDHATKSDLEAAYARKQADATDTGGAVTGGD